MMKRDWNSVRAVITGASRGLGRALTEGVIDRGGEVVMVARNRSALEAASKALEEQGGKTHAVVADVGAPNSAQAIAAQATELLGEVNLLIHNASTLGPVPLRDVGEVDARSFEEVFQVNVLGPQRLTNALLGAMRRHGAATVVAISSDAAVEAYPTWGAYGASKAALDHLTRVQAAELDGRGVRFLSFDPGEMDTQMHADAMPEADRDALRAPKVVADRILALLDGEIANGSREAV